MTRVFRCCLLAVVLATPALADEGMWTFNNFPSQAVKKAYGFEPTKAWLDHLRLASVRIAGGCSASVVSPDGLVMTNHHCARECIENLSGLKKKDFNQLGFYAPRQADEARCPAYELNQLVDITDVTSRVQDATKSVPQAGFADAQRAAIAGIEKECASSDDVRCEVVSLYRGGRYQLYTYRRFQDIRLVFAPEDAVAFFGGDPDNFTFPRYDLDVSFLRIYGADGKPLKTTDFLPWSTAPAKDGDLTFVSGNPGGTSRTLTVAQLNDDRDYRLPSTLFRLAELRGLLTEYQARGKEQKRHSNDLLFGVENSFKALKGRHGALADEAFYKQLVAREADFRARVKANPELQKLYGGTWDEVAALTKKLEAIRDEYNALERPLVSDLFGIARAVVRYNDEREKPNGERLREYADARLPQLKANVLSNKPIYDEFEITTLAWSLSKMRETLGASHPVVKKVLGAKSPLEVATRAVKGTRLKDLRVDARGEATGGVRFTLFNGGKAAVDASKDPMIELVRAYDAEARDVRHRYETQVDGPMKRALEAIARARFAVYGESIYPDATFTLRLSYGQVKGYEENGRHVDPVTQLSGIFERNTGTEPFALPKSWLAAKAKLDPATPFNMATTNDIIGGNSGSPVVNQKGEVVGLIFDGNIQSLGGDYGFDPALNRAVAVHSAAIVEALDKVYGARRIVDELKSASSATP